MNQWVTDQDNPDVKWKAPPSEEEGKKRVERGRKLIGQPFIHLPGNPRQHKVLEKIDGIKIRVEAVEMVWNDMHLIDYVCDEKGHYRKDLEEENNTLQLKVLDLAEKLYGDTEPYHGL